MTPRLIAIDTPSGGQVGIQEKPVVKGTMHVGVADNALVPLPGVPMGTVVLMFYRRHMTLAAEYSHRLFQQEIVLAAMRRMTLHTSPAFDSISRSRVVLVKKRAGTLRMALRACPGKAVGQIIIDTGGKAVTAKTGHRSGHDRMIGNPDEPDRFILMTGDAKIGVIILKQRPVLSMDFVTGRTVHLHFGMSVESIIVKIIAPYMTLAAYSVGLIPGQFGRIIDIIFRWILDMIFRTEMATDTGDVGGRLCNRRGQAMHSAG